MKKDIKKYLIGALIGAILFGTIGVYAVTQILSKDISYTKTDGTTTSVENALNELYNGIKPPEITFKFASTSYSSTSSSQANIYLGGFKNIYSKVKVQEAGQTNAKNCKIRFWSQTKSVGYDLELGKEYSVMSDTDGYKISIIYALTTSQNNSDAYCYYDITLYN